MAAIAIYLLVIECSAIVSISCGAAALVAVIERVLSMNWVFIPLPLHVPLFIPMTTSLLLSLPLTTLLQINIRGCGREWDRGVSSNRRGPGGENTNKRRTGDGRSKCAALWR